MGRINLLAAVGMTSLAGCCLRAVFHFSRCYIPWLIVTSLHLQSQQEQMELLPSPASNLSPLFCCGISLWLFPLPLLLLRAHVVTLDQSHNPWQSLYLRSVTLIASAKYFLICNTTYSQFGGICVWTSLGGPLEHILQNWSVSIPDS